TLWWRVLPQNMGCNIANNHYNPTTTFARRQSRSPAGISRAVQVQREELIPAPTLALPAASNGGCHTPPSAHNNNATFVDNQIQSRRKVAMMLVSQQLKN